MKKALALFFLAGCLGSLVEAELPSSFIGYWQGSPQFTVLGPLPYPFNFTIAALPNTANNKSAWLMGDSFTSSFPMIPCSQQQFWVTEDEGVVYCGSIRNFFERYFPAPISVSFNQTAVSDTMIQWCYQADCSGVSWTLTLQDDDTLVSSLFLPKPVHHLQVTLKRVAQPTPQHVEFAQFAASIPYPLPPPCNLSFALEIESNVATRAAGLVEDLTGIAVEADDGLVKCPVTGLSFASKKQSKQEHKEPAPHKSLPSTGAIATSYQHCYVLNPTLNVALSWTVHELSSSIDIQMSAPLSVVDGHFLALGFQPSFPAMEGADIVLGFPAADSPTGCVLSMYADQFVGLPVANPVQVISKTTVVTDNDSQMLHVQFTRPLNTGHHNITFSALPLPSFTIMWAIGPAPTSCSGTPSYHGPTRGVRCIDWFFPAEIFPEFMKC